METTSKKNESQNPIVAKPVVKKTVKMYMVFSSLLNLVLIIALIIALILLLSNKAPSTKETDNQLDTFTPTPTVVYKAGFVIKQSQGTDLTNRNNDITGFIAELSNYKISPNQRISITGQYSELKTSDAPGNDGMTVYVNNEGDVQVLAFQPEGGSALSINSELEVESHISYADSLMLSGSKIPNLGRVYIGAKGLGVWRYFDDKSQQEACFNSVGQDRTIAAPCGSGYILLNSTQIIKAECAAEDVAFCDAIMSTIRITKISD